MKINSNTFFLLLCSCSFVRIINAQSVIEDAILLSTFIRDENAQAYMEIPRSEQVYQILAKYTDSPTNVTEAKIEATFKNNPFLKLNSGAQGLISLDGNKKSTAGSSGSPWDAAIRGFTDFIISRAKTELDIAFFRRFKEELNDDKYKDLRILFPETTNTLNVIGVEIYQFDHYLNMLRDAFEEDLRLVLDYLPEVLENHKGDKVFANNPALMPSLRLALELRGWIDDEREPGEMLRMVTESEHAQKLLLSRDSIAFNTIRFVAFVSESLRNSKDQEHYWVNGEQLKRLKDRRILKIYLGLLCEESNKESYKTIRFPARFSTETAAAPKTIRQLLYEVGKQHQDSIEQYGLFIRTLGQKAESAMQAVIALRKLEEITADHQLPDEIKRQKMLDAGFNAFNGFTSILRKGLEIDELPYIAINTSVMAEARQITECLETGGELALSVAQKQYVRSMSKLILLLNKILVDKDDKPTFKKVMRYGTFMANVVEAKDDEEVEKAIEAIALPPGSYTIKRESRFSVALNAYLGVFSGEEYIKGVQDRKGLNNIGVTAPVGVSFSWGNVFPKAMRPWSVGFSVPLLDLGAVASYRLGNTEDTENAAEVAPTIQLKHIVAPGLFLEIGIGGTPLSFGLGGQVGARLRKIENETNKLGDAYYRLGASLKVDIPILNFYASPGKK